MANINQYTDLRSVQSEASSFYIHFSGTMVRFSNRVSPLYNKKSTILKSLQPLAILCKCLGMLSIENLFKTDVSKLKYNFLSFDSILKLIWLTIYFLGYKFISENVTYLNPTSLTVTSAMIVLSVTCHCTDNLFLDVLKFLDRYDKQFELLCGIEVDSYQGYIWVVAVILNCILAFYTCGNPSMSKCLTFYPLSILTVFINLPYIIVFHLYCAISREIFVRFRAIYFTLKNSIDSDVQPYFLEHCRILHAYITMSTERLSQCYGGRFTLHFLILLYVTIWYIWAKCLLSDACAVGLNVLIVGYYTLVLFCMCYCAYKITKVVSTVYSLFRFKC